MTTVICKKAACYNDILQWRVMLETTEMRLSDGDHKKASTKKQQVMHTFK